MTLPNTEQITDCPTGRFLDLWIAKNILEWKWEDIDIEGDIIGKNLVSSNGVNWIEEFGNGEYDFSFCPELSKDMNIAMIIANKLGIALIPQSAGDNKFYWFALDITKVRYHGDRIEIYEKNDSGICNENPALAVAQAAWYSMNYKEEMKE